MLAFLKKEYADEKFFKKVLENPRAKMMELAKELGFTEHLVGSPSSIWPVKDYVNNKLEEKAAIKMKLLVKAGKHAEMVKSKSGEYGLFIKSFNDNPEEVVVPFEPKTKLEDARSQGKALGGDIYRGIVTTKKGLAVRVVRKGLATARLAIAPGDERFKGNEGVKIDRTFGITGLDRNITQEALQALFKNQANDWKVVILRVTQD